MSYRDHQPSAADECLSQLEALKREFPESEPFASHLRNADRLSRLHQWCKAALGKLHLVHVSSLLTKELRLELSELQMLDIPTDILEFFPNWREGSREGFRPQPLGCRLTSIGASRPVKIIRLQLSPFAPTLSLAFLLLKRLMEVLPPSVQFLVAIEPGGNLEGVKEIIASFDSSSPNRVTLVELRTASVFAQDNACGVFTENGEAGLLLPRGFRQERTRYRDALEDQLSEGTITYQTFRSRLYWEGGNIVHDDHSCFIGSDSVRENCERLGIGYDETLALFEADFGRAVSVMGKTVQADTTGLPASLQSSFHLDLDLALAGTLQSDSQPTAFIASPRSGLALRNEVLSIRRLTADHFLEEDEAREVLRSEYEQFSAVREEELHGYRERLQEHDYQIIELPDLRIDPRENLFSTRNLDFTFCNVFFGEQDGLPSVYYLPYGIKVLDAEAKRIFEAARLFPRPVSKSGRLANMLMLFHGGLRCACSQIQ